MQSVRSSFVKYSLLGACLILLVSACSRKPNLIPYGYDELFTFPMVASSVAKIDYPILYVVDPTSTSINLRVKAEGERVWIWEGEFWKDPKEYQIALIKHGNGDAICETSRTAPQEKVTEIPCNFVGHTAQDYLDIPLAALLHYYPARGEELPTGTVSRVYYLVPMH